MTLCIMCQWHDSKDTLLLVLCQLCDELLIYLNWEFGDYFLSKKVLYNWNVSSYRIQPFFIYIYSIQIFSCHYSSRTKAHYNTEPAHLCEQLLLLHINLPVLHKVNCLYYTNIFVYNFQCCRILLRSFAVKKSAKKFSVRIHSDESKYKKVLFSYLLSFSVLFLSWMNSCIGSSCA